MKSRYGLLHHKSATFSVSPKTEFGAPNGRSIPDMAMDESKTSVPLDPRCGPAQVMSGPLSQGWLAMPSAEGT